MALFLPFVLIARRMRWLPWTIEARSYPWGRRKPPIVFSYAIRGAAECLVAIEELVAALERGDGRPELTAGEHLRESRTELPPMTRPRDL